MFYVAKLSWWTGGCGVEEKSKRLRDDPSRVIVLGGGRGGLAMLEMLEDEALATVVAVVDVDETALGMVKARELGIETFYDVETALVTCAPCVAFNLTGNEMVEEIAAGILGAGGVIGGLEARLMWRMVTDLKKTKNDLEYLATHDPLTGLCNRRYVTDQLEREVSQAVRYGVECSLAILDLDHFKPINDTYGHAAGDAVLSKVAHLMESSTRGTDYVARIGGDEFVILLVNATREQCARRAQLIKQKLNGASTNWMGHDIAIAASIGVRYYDRDHCDKNLLEQADQEMYVEKQRRHREVTSLAGFREHRMEAIGGA